MNFKQILLGIFLLITILACNNINSQFKGKNQIYSIQKAKSELSIDSLTNKPKQLIREFYLDYNIILIDTLSSVYFHKKKFLCLSGQENLNRSFPFFINLKPKFMEKSQTIEMVLKRVLENKEKVERVYLISNVDTISDSRYFNLKQYLIRNRIKVSTRIITEEERLVMTAILENKEYRPDKINWKKTLNVFFDVKDYIEIDDIIEVD